MTHPAVQAYLDEQTLVLHSRWAVGHLDRGMGHGSFAVITSNERLVVKCSSQEIAEHIVECHNNALTVTSYPVYILDLHDGSHQVLFPEGKRDIAYHELWPLAVPILLDSYGVHEHEDSLIRMDRCMRKGRINSKGVLYYGEEPTDELLQLISDAVGEKLEWGRDSLESRTDFDREVWCRILAGDTFED